MASFGADKILLNESLFAFNNLIVATKNVVEKSKTSAIQKLIRQIKLLTKKKTSNELQADQNKRKSQKLLEEIELIKKLKYNTAVLFSFENEGATFPEILKDKLKTATAEEKVLARIALSKMVTQAIDKIKNDPKILTQGWKKIFIQYQARLEKRQNWKEKQKLIKVIEDKLKTAEDVLSADAADSAEKEEGAEEEEEEENVLEEIPDDEEEKETKETTTLPPQIPKSAPVSSPTKKIIADKIEKAAAVVKKDTKATKPAPLPKKEKVVVTEKSKLQQKFKQLDKDDPGTKKLATKDRKSIIEMFAQTRDVKFSDDESSEDDEESEESAENDENSPNEDEDDDSDEEGQKSEDEEEDSDSNVIQEFNFNDLVKRTLHKSAEVKKTLKPLVFDKKPAEMEIRQLNLDDLNDLDEIPMYKKKKVNSISDQDNEMDSDEEEEDSDEEESEEEEEEDESPKKKRKRTESSEDESTVKSTKVTKQQQDPFFLDKNGNEVEAGHDYYRNNRSFDQEESNYVGYDGGYRSNYDKEAFKNKRNSLNSSFTSSLSSDRRPNQITDTPYYHNSERGGRGGSRGGFNSASSRGGYERRDGFQPRGGGGFDRGGRGRGGFSSDRGSFGGGRGGFSSERGGGYERGGFAAGRGNPFRGNSSSSFAGAQQRHQPQPPTLDVSKLHPSWQAKKQNEDKLKAMKFEGKKMKFDDQ